MKDLAKLVSNTIISSYDFLQVINKFREEDNRGLLKLNKFNTRILDECPEINKRKKIPLVLGQGAVRDFEVLELTKDQVLLVGMRESKYVRRKVLEWVKILELESEELTLKNRTYKVRLMKLEIEEKEASVEKEEVELKEKKIKHRKLIADIEHNLEVCKLLGKSFDVNQYIDNRKLGKEELKVLRSLKDSVGATFRNLGGIELEHRSMTKLLKEYNIPVRAQEANEKLIKEGILGSDRLITTYGKYFGFNHSTGDLKMPSWYVERFPELVELIIS